jgi:phosphatidylglycerophosphatase A
MLLQIIDTAMKLKEEAIMLLATGFYIGNIPFAPGTFGSLLGLPLCFFLAGLTLPLGVICTLLFISFAVWVANTAEKLLRKTDPGCIVIDEMAGMAVTLVGLPFTLNTAVLGFICFRILDILKPFPIRILDQKITGGAGIVMDDVAAGIIANLFLRIIIYFL